MNGNLNTLKHRRSYLFIQVLAGLRVADLVFQEGPGAHLNVHDVWVAERVQQVLQLDKRLSAVLHLSQVSWSDV